MIMSKSRFVLSGLAGLLLASAPARALILVGRGNGPVRDQNWRAGALEVANLKSRVGWWEGPPFGGAMWNFLYRGDTDAFNEALKLFVEVRAPSLELIVCDGPAESSILKDDKDPKLDVRYDWDFVIWDVQGYYRLYGNPTSAFMADDPNFRHPLPPPRITVFIGGGGSIQWDKVQMPKGITVIDRRAVTAGVTPGQGAVVAGNAFDMATSKPLADARVTLDRSAAQGKYEAAAAGQSDADGRFRIEKIPAGTYRVWVSAPGYASIVAGYKRLVADGYLTFDDVELAREATVSGAVVDDAGKPIAGATVRLADVVGMNGQSYPLVHAAKATTDAEGRFEIGGAPAGFGRVMCFAKGHHAPLGELHSVPAKDVTIRMSVTGTIKGKVIGGKPAPAGGILVSVAPEGERIGKWGGGMRVKPDGTFQFDNVPPGTYFVSTGPLIPGEPLDAKTKKITVKAGQTVDVELTQ